MIGQIRYRIKVNLPLEGVKKGVWYEYKDGIEYFDCWFEKDYNGVECYYINTVSRIPKEYVKVISSYMNDFKYR